MSAGAPAGLAASVHHALLSEQQAMSKHQRSTDGLGIHGRTLVAALDIMEETQATVPSLARIAEAVEVPLADLQRIFPSNQAVLVAAAEQALVRLMDSCVKAVVKVDPEDAVAQFCALGDAYIDWADTHRSQFRLLSDERLLDTLNTPQLRRYLNSLTELMSRMLERARDAGNLAPEENIPLMVLSSRTFAYGVARMVIDQRMGEWYPELPPVDAAKMVLRDFVRRIARGSIRRAR
ncbi:TetR/AcrR family transcriptional regulator [Paracoccus spongiarum]|uniref:HTH-type transcriptional regulator MT1864/Rv1816-like C-terminal domain-containing protein n=1 Tax=Paracoccus spongiarum TaxID=3064387 RepID=A0ABT9JGL6_9RHOB|nr:hypothetical protein [Paracoccus sp. 2205BS29-5]MDP5308939.1 hypothetical protein [Paracoccus sp. 2205BS29-5]